MDFIILEEEGEFSDINFIDNKNKKPKKHFTQFSITE